MSTEELEKPSSHKKSLSTSERILKATLELVYKNGYKGTTTKMIANLAQVNEASIFRIFKNKEGVLIELLRRNEDKNAPIIEFFKGEFSSAVDFLNQLSFFFIDTLKEKKEVFLFCLNGTGNDYCDINQVFMKLLVSVTHLLSNKLKELNQQGLLKKMDYEAAAFTFLHSLVGGFMFENILGKGEFPLDIERLRKYACKIVLNDDEGCEKDD